MARLLPVDPLADLWNSALHGRERQEALRTLLHALGPAMLRAVRGVLGAGHADVEDVLQEAMSALCSALPNFRGECQLCHFAARVAAQTAMNARRRAGYRMRSSTSVAPQELEALALEQRSPADDRFSAMRRKILRDLLDELPTAQAEVLVLHVILGHSVEECANATQVPINTVRSRLRTALASLRKRIQSDETLAENLEIWT
ncbi:MAG TPA: sigma-70 family RNA polymerase sigma factor [Polyangiaceae bacterium]